MSAAPEPTPRRTPQSLFAWLCNPSDEARFNDALGRLHLHYVPDMYKWCRSKGVSDADAEDLVQDLFVKLHKKLRTFKYEPNKSFTSWLKTVTRHAASDWKSSFANRRVETGQNLDEVLTIDNVSAQLMTTIDQAAFNAAWEQVQVELSETETGRRYCEIFIALTEHGETPASIAERLGIKRHAVDVAKSRVILRLKQAVKTQSGDPPDPPAQPRPEKS